MEPDTGGVRRLFVFAKKLILEYSSSGITTGRIQKILQSNHNVKTTRQSIRLFLKRYKETGSIGRKAHSSHDESRKVVRQLHKKFINMWIAHDNELSSEEIKKRLFMKFGISISKEYVCKIRRELGWTVKRVKYCQLITHKNKLIRLEWTLNALVEMEAFKDVIFVDESIVEMCSNGRLFFYNPGSGLDRLPAKSSKPKHSYKVHIWGGISYRGRTDCCVFTGIMDSVIYQKILRDNFLPFVARKFPDGYRLYQATIINIGNNNIQNLQHGHRVA